MSSSEDENRKHSWDAVIRELVAKGEVPEDVLHDSDAIIRWWRSLDPAKQEEIKSRVEELSQGVFAEVLEKKTTTKEELDFRVTEVPSGKQIATPSAPRMRKASFVILGLALVLAIVYSVIVTGDRNALNTELEFVQSVLASTQSELISAKQTLASTQAELDSTKTELGSTKQILASTETELDSTKQTLVSAQSELTSTKQILVSTKAELETAEAKILLFQETFGADVYSGIQPQVTGGGSVGSPTIKNNPIATNPTWGELKAFLLSDPTDDEYYSLGSFNCVSFAEMLHNNAEDAGIKSAFVAINFEDEPVGHAINAFKTTNRGLVYVDCTGGTFEERLEEKLYHLSIERDRIAYVKKNRKYGVLSMHTFISPEYSYYEECYEVSKEVLRYWWVPGDIVESIEMYW